MTGPKHKSRDPLYQLFEQHMLTKSYEDSNAFTKEVANQYLVYLDSTLAHIPLHIRSSVLEDLESETHEMLVKKMYGCVKNTDHVNFGKVIQVYEAELKAIEFCIPAPNSEEKTDKND